MRQVVTGLGRAAVDGAARLLLRLADTVTSRSRVPNPVAAVRAIRVSAASGSDCCKTVHDHLRAAGLLTDQDHDVCGAACAPCPVQDLLDVLGPWGLRGAVRTAVELYDTYGDPDDVLSTTQVEQLRLATAHFHADD
ncbi:hypothetical protein ACFYZ8_33705 [Streptomyces sp. NPDC001668]|uniref:hypothetical protein n=1 Tax=Streptomyces sp. NPDC001668 TaxID=3364598 RepID=UPI0036C76C3A